MKLFVRFSMLVTTLSLLLITLSPDATAQRKLYRWTDGDGKVHYTDQLPAEAVKAKQEELNNQGMSIKTTERARTAEEQAAWEAEQAVLEKEQKAAEEKAKMDAMLTGSYPAESDLQRAYRERFDLIEQSLESARVGIRSQEKSLSELLEHAADLERNNKPVPIAITDSITRARAAVDEQRSYLARRETERTHLQGEFDALLARYRELKGIEAEAKSTKAESAVSPSS